MRPALLATTLLVAIALVLRSVHASSPIQHWLLWRYLIIELSVTVFAASCWLGGHSLLVRVFRLTLSLEERLGLSLPVGLLAFGLGVFVVGVLRLLYWPVFFLLPALLVAPGWRQNVRFLRRLAVHLGSPRLRWPAPRLGPRLAVAGGLLGVLVMWLPTLTTQHVGYDSLWYHWTIAEQYIADHRVSRFDEGWVQGTVPHLASLIYTWGQLLPSRLYFMRAELCLQLDFLSFAAMLLTVPPLVGRLVGRVRTGEGGRLLPRWRAPLLFLALNWYALRDRI